MMPRNKVIAIESIAVMLVLILFALTVFVVIDAGSSAFEKIVGEKKNTETARVAYSYINMKIKQNDEAAMVDVVGTEYGNALQIILPETEYATYIFFADNALYECIARAHTLPKLEAANRITGLDGFEIRRDDTYIRVTCVLESGSGMQVINGTVGLRT